jgi:hypothetical protein
MILQLNRTMYTTKSTIGKLYVNDVYFSVALELPWNNGANIPDTDCIPQGSYQVILNHSPRLGYETPELVDVPKRLGIRIHIANYPGELKGCIGVGSEAGEDAVWNSRVTFAALMNKLVAVQPPEEIWINVGRAGGGGESDPHPLDVDGSISVV